MGGKIWFTSDWHFCHDKEFIYVPRGFKTVDEMNEAIVERHNSVVAPEDIVYCLGDCMLKDNERGLEYIKRLNGKIHIIFGNHDTDNRKMLYNTYNANIVEANKHSTVIKVDGYRFYLSHYPTMTANLGDDPGRLKSITINLYGHTHQKTNFYNEIPFIYHVGVDSHNCFPVSSVQIIEDIKRKIDDCTRQP